MSADEKPTDLRRRLQGVTRRRFIQTAAGTAGAVAWGSAGVLGKRDLPVPQHSGIDRLIVVMMENRSFDHMLGWLPGARGRQAGLSYPDRTGTLRPTYALAPDYQGCGHPDPDHSYEGGRIQFNNGACDGFLLSGESDEFAIGYYTAADLPFYGQAAPQWTVCDEYYSPIMAATFPNRMYLHCGQTDRITNSFALSNLPTIWDRMADRKVEARYYFSDIPFVALWGSQYLSIARPLGAFLDACATGTLPEVSFVEPRFVGAQLGISNDDHPHADIRDGQVFQNLIYTAVTSSPDWYRTLLVFVYDEWGGFFDHAAPSAAAIPPADRAAGNMDGLRGFRVPALMVSPYARRGHVSSILFDHTSILQFIEWRWKTKPLTVRDATANNLAEALDFANPDLAAPFYAINPGPYAQFCGPSEPDKWVTIETMARSFGFLESLPLPVG